MSTTTTTTTTTTAAASASCAAQLYNIPVHDAACAMPMNSTYHTLMTSCCGSASVVAYADCDYYCLAQDENVGDLAECLIKGSAAGQVWCNTNANATATGTATPTSTATGNGTSSVGDDSASATGDAADPTGTNGARPLAVGVDAKGAMVLALLALGVGVVAPGLAFF
ncbi:uncharacterized protein DSM5745_00288 [Aspergillus mulundensis]|uniref:Uncharacterized protein n=1 Tax=Aspergillus mulundensis TaxID=1810919 RepID=A0A3D8T337_9EURO|nr:hypothetical protein DSM5745_00288 [Aspergillus mulundensis]RDW92966.1 hypothetical protein DSM5745_00288 [Aspergillus mulundensis]